MSRLLADIGTIEWARRTNGILGRGERARFMAATVLASARLLPELWADRRAQGATVDPSRLTPPDTPFEVGFGWALRSSPWSHLDRATAFPTRQ